MKIEGREWGRAASYSQWARAAYARARASGENVLTLFDSSVPEPWPLLREVMAGAVEPALSPFFTSAFGDGNPFVLDMLAGTYGVGRAQIISTTGATGGLALLYRALARPGNHVLVETPGFDLFADLADAHGLLAETFVRSGDDYAIDLDRLERMILPDTRLIVLSNLHNPSGMAVAHETMLGLARLAERRELFVVVDEVYGDYADAAARPCPAARLSPRMISLSSLTKIHGLGPLRCGWIVGSPEVMAVVRDVNERVEFGISTVSHAIAAHVLDRRADFDGYTASVLAQARPVFDRWYREAEREGLVSGKVAHFGCICFPRLPGIADTSAFSDWLCETRGVLVAPGECFGAPGHVRIGFGHGAGKLEQALSAFADGIRAYAALDPASLRMFAR